MYLYCVDDSGAMQIFALNMAGRKKVQAHTGSCRCVTLSPLDSKFATCSDDGSVKVWDSMKTSEPEQTFRGRPQGGDCLLLVGFGV
jgi:polyadenylation factor subunit 2